MTTAEFADLLRQNSGKITTGTLSSSASSPSSSVSPKKRRQDPLITSPAKRQLAPQFHSTDLTQVETIDDVFDGKEIVVLNDPPGVRPAAHLSPLKKTSVTAGLQKAFHLPRAELEVRLTQLGASISQNPSPKTFCVASFKSDDVWTKNYIRLKYLVVKGDWLCRCVAAKKLLPLSPLDCLYADEKTKASFLGKFDRFGDAFDDDVDEEKLGEILESMKSTDEAGTVGKDDVEYLREQLLEDSNFALFISKTFYLDGLGTGGAESAGHKDSSPIDVTRYAGKIVETLDETVTHVICDDPEKVDWFKRLRRTRDKKFHLVTRGWIERSIEDQRTPEERLFEPS